MTQCRSTENVYPDVTKDNILINDTHFDIFNVCDGGFSRYIKENQFILINI